MNQAAGAVQGAANKMAGAGTALTLGVTAPLVALGNAAVQSSTSINYQLANVASLGVENAGKFKNSLQELGVEMAIMPDELAQGLYDVYSAFGPIENAFFILEQSAMAAKAGLATTSESMSLLAAVTRGYGDTSSEAVSKVSDLAFMAVNLGQTTFPELAASIGRVVPLASSLGVAQEELFGVMATATGVTGNTSEVATQMRQTLQALLSPTEDTAKLMRDLGYSTGQAMMADLGYIGVLQTLQAASEATGKPLQKFISGIEGQTLAIALNGNLAGDYVDRLAAVSDASGSTARAFEAQTNGINKAGFAMQQARVKMVVMAERLGDGLGPAILAATNAIGPFVDGLLQLSAIFANMPQGQQMAIIGTLAAVAAIGPALLVLAGIASGLATFISILGAFAGVAAAIVSPIGLLVAGLVALAAAVLYFDVGGIGTAISGFLGNLGTMASELWNARNAIGEYVLAVADAGVDSIEAKDAFSVLPPAVQGIAGAFGGVVQAASTFAANMQPHIDSAVAAITGFKTQAEAAFAAAATAVSNFGASEAWTTTTAAVQQNASTIWTTITGAFNGDISLEQAWTTLQAELNSLQTNVTALLQSDAFATFATDLAAAFGLDTLAATLSTQLQPVTTTVSTAVTDLQTQFTTLSTTVSTTLQPALDVLQAPFERLKETFATGFANLPTIGASLGELGAKFGQLGAAFQTMLAAFGGGEGGEGGGKGIDWMQLAGGATVALLTGAMNGASAAIQGLGVTFGAAVTQIGLTVTFATGFINGFTQIIQGIQDRDWSQVFAGVTTVFTSFGAFITDTVANMTGTVSQITTVIGGALTNTLTDLGFDEMAEKVNAFVAGVSGFFDMLSGLAGGEITLTLPVPEWITSLQAWTWPVLPTFSWPTLPVFTWPTLPTFSWPTLPTWTWPSLPTFSWPSLPSWKWPSIPVPDWVNSLLGVFGGGQQLGTSYFHGGMTWIGEAGPEPVWFNGPQLVNLPRGAQVMRHTDARRAFGNGAGNNMTINATVAGQLDIHRMLQMIEDYLTP